MDHSERLNIEESPALLRYLHETGRLAPDDQARVTSLPGGVSNRTVLVEPSYFQTVVSGLVLGDSFSELHGTPGHEAAIVNQRFASVYLGAGSPIGRRLDQE